MLSTFLRAFLLGELDKRVMMMREGDEKNKTGGRVALLSRMRGNCSVYDTLKTNMENL